MDRQSKRYVITTVIAIVLSVVGMIGSCASLVVIARHRAPSYQREDDVPPSVEIVTTPPVTMPIVPQATGVSADDGELHDARTQVEGYEFQEGSWILSRVEHMDIYDMDVKCNFSVSYPVLIGDLPGIDKANDLLRSTAMETVRTYYEDPTKETAEKLKNLVKDVDDFAPTDADALLSSEVSYAVSYNTEKFLSVCFSDEYCLGSVAAEFIVLRTVNINLETGEVYTIDDVLTVDDDLATSFLDNLVQTSGTDRNEDGQLEDDECLTIHLGGRETLVEALQGKGELANRVSTHLFVDGNGQPNLGATYWVSANDGYVRGWWDVTITDEQVRRLRKDSTFWELLSEEAEESAEPEESEKPEDPEEQGDSEDPEESEKLEDSEETAG